MYICAVPWQSAKVRALPANPRIEALLFRIFCKWAFRPALKMVKTDRQCYTQGGIRLESAVGPFGTA